MIQVLDVGANVGSFGLELALRNSALMVHLIEPVPDIAEELRSLCMASGLSNAFVHEVALGDVDGEVELHVSMLGDRGTTSMLPFDDIKIASDPYWSQRTDLRHDTKVRVPTMRLCTFLEKHNLQHIDFIKIDVQGMDLVVLASAENRIGCIQAGMLEVSVSEINALYIGERQNLRTALNFLEENDLKIVAIKPNDPACNEVNIYFSREPRSWAANIAAWGMQDLPAFDGKHYWHASSASPLYADDLNRKLIVESKRLMGRIDRQELEINRLNMRIHEQDAEINRLNAHIDSEKKS